MASQSIASILGPWQQVGGPERRKKEEINNFGNLDQWRQSNEEFLKEMQPIIESTPAAARVGEVEDIAPLVAFLCSEEARWVTGSVLSANGGLYN